ncbi:GGDEF domain-containing protein [Sulfurovum sp.]|uniref:GGDEF domain-containing protein n=1 Tax=Sulfurovum sp. TaxID=1969726 RepID=UPI003567F3A2
MKRDWSVFRITILLYAIVILLPLNYYFAYHSFESMQNDGVTMNRLVYSNGAIQRVIGVKDPLIQEQFIDEIETSFKAIDHDFLQAPANAEYVSLFRADESYQEMISAWIALKMAFEEKGSVSLSGERCWKKVNSFANLTEEMLAYKSETMLDRLYLSLIFTMLAVIALVSFVRLYIRIQIEKHAIHDHVTGLYNKKYYNEALQKAKLLATRQNKPLSLLVVTFDKYDEIRKDLDKKRFEAFLLEFGKQFREFFRQSDTICRIEENCFVAISPDANLENENKMALRLEKHFGNHHFQLHRAVNIRVGVASYQKDGGMTLLEEAQKVMRRSALVALGSEA